MTRHPNGGEPEAPPASGERERLPFGPYRGQTVEHVADLDPAYLEGLVDHAVGSPRLRAAAAGALVRRRGLRTAVRSWWQAARRPASIAAAVVGVAAALVTLGGMAAARAALHAVDAPWPGGKSESAAATATLGGGRTSTPETALAVRTAPSAPPRSAFQVPGTGTSPTSDSEEGLDGASLAAASLAGAPCGERSAGAVPAARATEHVGEFQAVEFEVVRAKDTGRVTFLNSHEPYQGHFYVVVFPGDYGRFPQPPATLFEGRCILVQGTVELYRGAPQVVLRGPEDVRVVGDADTAAPAR